MFVRVVVLGNVEDCYLMELGRLKLELSEFPSILNIQSRYLLLTHIYLIICNFARILELLGNVACMLPSLVRH